MSVTIADVAARAGVSPATVSRVLNGNSYVADKTRRLVLVAIEELNYRPNLVASALMTKKTNTIGLLVPDVGNPYFAEIARAVEAAAHASGLNVVICNTDEDPRREERDLMLLRQKGVDGVILTVSPGAGPTVERLLQDGFPVCLVARDLPTLPVNCVRVDDFRGAYLATRHLLELGHRLVVMLLGEPVYLRDAEERVRGFRTAMREAGQGDEARVLYAGSFSLKGAVAAGEQLLRSDPQPTAVFAYNDTLAIGFLHAAYRAGLNVPRDVSVVSFDGTVLASVTVPPLTAVVQPIGHMGRMAVELLKGAGSDPQRIIVQPELRLGESTAPPGRDG